MKARIRVYYDSKIAVFNVVPDEDSIKYLGEEVVFEILRNGKIESVKEAS